MHRALEPESMRSQGPTLPSTVGIVVGEESRKSVFHKAEDFKAFWEQVNNSFTDCGTAFLREAPRVTSAPEAIALKRLQGLKKGSKEAREQHEG